MTRIALFAGAAVLSLAASQRQAAATTYSYTGAVQTFTAAQAGTYDILAYGAAGGAINSFKGFFLGGAGAEAGGDVYLAQDQTISVVVGGQGGNGGGGGGGSFVFTGSGINATPLVVAGGGGGGGYQGAGSPGQAGTAGSAGGSSNAGGMGGAGGTNGQGGTGGASGGGPPDQPFGGGGGGGGFLTAGSAGEGGGIFGGLGGGAGSGSAAGGGGTAGANGSFGGGGGAGYSGSGGGGGYSGGGGGAGAGDGGYAGGGGGSFLAMGLLNNADLLDLAGGSFTPPAGLDGNGEVIITLQAAAMSTPEPASAALVGSFLVCLGLVRRRRNRGWSSRWRRLFVVASQPG